MTTIDKWLQIDHPFFTNPNLDKRFLGTFESMVLVSLCYVPVIALLSWIVRRWEAAALKKWEEAKKKDPEAPKPSVGLHLTKLLIVHNFIMAVYSLYAFVGTAAVLWRNWKAAGFSPTLPFCDPNHEMKKDYDFWVYSFYLSKYVEWLDTVFLVISGGKSQIPTDSAQKFLHVFHHSTTASIVWLSWRWTPSLSWVGPLTNSIVHVFMYFYYMTSSVAGMISPTFKKKVLWFGQFITPIQLLQFFICMFTLIAEVTLNRLYPDYCTTDWRSIGWFIFTYSIFMALFFKLYADKIERSRKIRAEQEKQKRAKQEKQEKKKIN